MVNELEGVKIEGLDGAMIDDNTGVITTPDPGAVSDARPISDKSNDLEPRATSDASPRGKGLKQFMSMPVLAELLGGFGASIGVTVLVTKVADSVLSHQTRAFDHTVLDKARTTRHTHKKLTDPAMIVLSAAGEPRALYPLAALTAA